MSDSSHRTRWTSPRARPHWRQRHAWTTTTCGNNNVASTAVSSCTPVTPTSANGYLTVSCNTVTNSNVPVQTCSTSSATSANGYLSTSCSVNSTTVPSGSCVASPATSGNGWTATTCPVVTSPVAGVASCRRQAPSAPDWTTTTCPVQCVRPTDPVATCNASRRPPATRGWPRRAPRSRPAPTVVSSCNPSSPTIANNYTSTVCAPLTGNKPAVRPDQHRVHEHRQRRQPGRHPCRHDDRRDSDRLRQLHSAVEPGAAGTFAQPAAGGQRLAVAGRGPDAAERLQRLAVHDQHGGHGRQERQLARRRRPVLLRDRPAHGCRLAAEPAV